MTPDQILSVVDRETVKVDVLGGVYVRSLTVGEQLAIEKRIKELEDNASALMALQLAFYISDEQGNPLFTEETAVKLLDKRPTNITRIIEAGVNLNGWTPNEEAALSKN